MTMFFKMSLVGLLLMSSVSVQAKQRLVELDNAELSQVQGQGGADLSLTLSINHAIPGLGSTVPFQYNCGTASTQEFCRFAVNFANRQDANGNLFWLVFKKIQGTIQIDRIGLEGSTVTVAPNSYRSALLLTFYDTSPIKIRNFGFESLAIETDTGTGAAQKGFLVKSTYSTPGFDQGLERGFVGLNVHGNLAMSGTVKMFSCAPSASARC